MFGPKEPDPQAILYPLFFGTNRQPVDRENLSKGYSGERDSRVNFGTCTVLVPKSHKIGRLGSPWWKQLLTLTPDGRLKLQWPSLKYLEDLAFWETIRREIAKREPKNRICVVYIHGYNVSFEEATLRAAQLGVDLKVTGVMSFFSWPSKGRFVGYHPDGASVEASEKELTAYLSELLGIVGNGCLHVIAHSMGNRALLRTMNDLLGRIANKNQLRFGQVFLAAADVDAKVFHDLANAYHALTKRTTLYVSSKDLALASSGIIADYPRAGFVPPVTIVQGIDTVEASAIDLSFLGHGYYADARNLLQDMHALLENDLAPERRFGLVAASANGLGYWRINR
jgi:esterase/lipase superfamily enzyme